MKLNHFSGLCGLAALVVCSTVSAQTALDEFMASDDGAFAYVEYAEAGGFGWRSHFLKLTSQRWRGSRTPPPSGSPQRTNFQPSALVCRQESTSGPTSVGWLWLCG